MSSMVPTTSSESFGRFSQTYVVALSISGHCFQKQDFFGQVVKSAHLRIVRSANENLNKQVAIEVVGERGK